MKATTGAIWEAASTVDSRPILNHVRFDAVAGTLTATNSYIAARVPCEVEDGDESGLIPAAALKAAKGASLVIRDGKATLKLADGERSWDLHDGVFPDVDKIFGLYEPIEFPFGINHELLGACARALGCGGKSYIPIKLHPSSPLKGIFAEAGSRLGGEGVLMPVRLDGEQAPMRPDLTLPAVVLAGVEAASAALRGRKGRKKAVDAFHTAALRATLAASEAA